MLEDIHDGEELSPSGWASAFKQIDNIEAALRRFALPKAG
jgi:hypothetical protein